MRLGLWSVVELPLEAGRPQGTNPAWSGLTWRWALGETCSLGRPAICATAWVELFVATCAFLSPDVLPAVFPRGCLSPSDCHTDKSASRVLGRAGAGGGRGSPRTWGKSLPHLPSSR